MTPSSVSARILAEGYKDAGRNRNREGNWNLAPSCFDHASAYYHLAAELEKLEKEGKDGK